MNTNAAYFPQSIIFVKIRLAMYIHETDSWPIFTWDRTRTDPKLAAINKATGYLEAGADMRKSMWVNTASMR